MKVICVDDEKIMLEGIMMTCREITDIEEVTGFRKSTEALEYVQNNKVDVAFLDIDMPVIDGMTLARKMKKSCPDLKIIFTTGYSEFAIEAFKMKASGYLLKPIKKNDIQQEIDSLKQLSENAMNMFAAQNYAKMNGYYDQSYYDGDNEGGKSGQDNDKADTSAAGVGRSQERDVHPRIFARTFGNFDLFVDRKPVVFTRKPSKELLAYLIDKRGATVSRKEMAAVIFEDEGYNRSTQSYLTKLLNDMNESLRAVNANHIVLRESGMYYVDVNSFACDAYDYLDGKPDAISRFTGEYMTQYSWAEGTLGEFYR